MDHVSAVIVDNAVQSGKDIVCSPVRALGAGLALPRLCHFVVIGLDV